MEQKIAELTQKIFQEGVERGNKRAEEIIKDAEVRREKLLAEAKEQAAKIIADAQRSADDLKRNTEAEVKLSGQQAISAIKQQILDLLSARVMDAGVGKALSDAESLKEYIRLVLQNWNPAGSERPRLELLLSADKQQEIEKALQGSLRDVLSKGVEVKFSPTVKNGFQLRPEGASYRISLTETDFAEFFKEFLRPRTRRLLFSE